MKKLLRLFFPLSLRVRFLLATAAVVLVLSLAYGMVALIGYSVSFDKTTFRLLRGESNLFYTLAKWENNKLHVELPENIDKQSPTMTLIYDENGQLLWAQRDVPWLMKMIQPDWLKSNGFHEIEADVNDTSLLLSGDHSIQQQLQEVREDDDDAEMTHSVAVNVYPATSRMPKLTIVVVDTIPVELKSSYMVWSWFIYVLSANLLLVIPLLWVAAWWSLRPIEALAKEVRELEEHNRELLNPATTRELTSLVRNLNRLLKSERERYDKYRTTLTDLTHSLKTPLAVLQSTLRSLRSEKMSVSDAEPVMLEQISRISQQIGYYLHRASMRGGTLLSRELHPVAPLLDNLTSALNKVYQRKGVNISLDISPEISFVGEQNDFVEVMGNVLDNSPGERTKMSAIEVKNLVKKFHGQTVLHGIDLEVKPGEVVAIIGPSGSGKTTLLRSINLLEQPEAGTITVGDITIDTARSLSQQKSLIRQLRQHVGFVFQNFNLFPHRTVLENIIEGPVIVKGEPKEEATARARELLAKVGLAGKETSYPRRLSGGQQQRVAIARALAMRPEVILFDEPTSALDPELVGEVLNTIRQLAQEKRTMVIVTHEMSFARDVADRAIFMDQGRIVEQGAAKALFADPEQPRTRQFLEKFLLQ